MKRLVNILWLFIASLFCCGLAATPLISDWNLADGLVSGRLFWFHLVMWLGSASLLLGIWIGKGIRISWADAGVLLYGLVVWLHYDMDSNLAPEKLLMGGQLVVCWFALRLLFARQRLLRPFLWGLWLLVGLYECVLGIAQLYGHAASNHALFNLTGTFFNPGPYSGFLAVLLPLAFHGTYAGQRIVRAFSWACFFMLLVILPAGMSRTAWLAAAAGGVFVFVVHHRTSFMSYAKQYQAWTRGIGILLIGAFIAVSWTLYHFKKDSADGRFLMWRVACEAIAENRGIGTGLGSFPAQYANAQAHYLETGTAQERYVAGCPPYAFNEYLQIGVEQGLIGLALFLFLIGYLIYQGTKRRMYGAAGALLSLAVFAFASYPLQLPEFWVLLVCLGASCMGAEKVIPQKAWVVWTQRVVLSLASIFSVCIFMQVMGYYEAYRSWNRVRSLYENRAYETAAKGYERLYLLLCHRPEYLFETARSLKETVREEEAIRYLERGTQVSSDPMMYYVLAQCEQAIGRYPEAEAHLLYAIRILPERIYPYYLLALLYAEPAYYHPEKLSTAIDTVLHKKPKVESTAIREMREKVRKLRFHMK